MSSLNIPSKRIEASEKTATKPLPDPPAVWWAVGAALFICAGAATYHEARDRLWKYDSTRYQIALCRQLIDEAPDMTGAWSRSKDYGDVTPDVSDDLRREIEVWAGRVESELDHVGEFGRLTAELRDTDRSYEHIYMRSVLARLNDYMISLR